MVLLLKEKIKIDKISGKLAGPNTPEEYIEEKIYKEVHNILYYCDKDNPNGPIPKDPAYDPQYNNWENAVQKWLKKYNEKANANKNDNLEPIDTTAPPTEIDDVHTIENKPQLNILNPIENSIISANYLTISVEANSKRGIKKYEYWLDNKIIPSNNTNNVTYPLYNIDDGEHVIKVKVSDDVGNYQEKIIDIQIRKNGEEANINILYPKNNSSFPLSAFPLVFTINILGANNIQYIHFCYKKINDNGPIKCIIKNDLLLDGQNNIKWKNKPNEKGSYKYYFQITTKNKHYIKSDQRFIILK